MKMVNWGEVVMAALIVAGSVVSVWFFVCMMGAVSIADGQYDNDSVKVLDWSAKMVGLRK